MAETNYVRLAAACHCGKPVMLAAGPGRPRKYCEDHTKATPHTPKRAGYPLKNCVSCGCEFAPRQESQRTCSRSCYDRVKGGWQKAQEMALTCKACGSPYTSKDRKSLYCCCLCKQRAIKLRHGTRLSDAERDARSRARVEKAKSRAIAALTRTIKRLAMARKARQAQAARDSCVCVQCGAKFRAARGNQILCSVRCQSARRKSSEAFKARKRAWRTARKALQRARTAEVFDPLQVLERDGWRCQICGRDTPRKLRGTYKPNAPEVDHIVAISKGGAHSMSNTQCACRSCNAAKADGRPIGQVSIFLQ